MAKTDRWTGAAALLALLAAAPLAQGADDLYNRAYVLENEGGEYGEAAEVYARLLERDLEPEMRAKVEERLAICREELACEDFAGLMPGSPLLYLELNRPGDQLEALLEEVGLLQMARQAAGESGGGQGVSPALVQGVLGMRGAAVAITGINPATGQPTGVAILHPGDLELVRGLIETALPTGARAAGDVGGHPTYDLQGQGFVTLTKRMVVASSHKREIRRVLERLEGTETASLADDAMLMDAMGERKDALLTLCANPSPLVPLARMAATQDADAAMVMSLCDPASVETLVARLGVLGGLSLDLALNMVPDHENLIFDLLRSPPVQRETLARVPAGVAAFNAAALNPPRRYTTEFEDDAYVSLLDVGRELFGNIGSMALYVLPPDAAAPGLLPDVGAIFSVNEPERSRALWHTALGLASALAGADPGSGPQTFDVRGTPVRRFPFPEEWSVLVGVEGDEVYLATTQRTMEAALATREGAASVLDDEDLRIQLERIGPETTGADVYHVGRILELARRYAPEGERGAIDAVLPHVSGTTASFLWTHDADTLRIALTVSELPDVGLLIARFRGDGAPVAEEIEDDRGDGGGAHDDAHHEAGRGVH